MFELGWRDFSLKYEYQGLENLHGKAKNIWHAKCSKAQLFGICLTLLQEKMIAPILF